MKYVISSFLVFVSACILVGCQDTNNSTNTTTLTPSTVSKQIASPFFGSGSSPVQMVIFTDFQCPACIAFHAMTSTGLFANYVDTGKIGLTFKNYPLPGHPHAARDALAALCAASQGKYLPYGDIMYDLEAMKEFSDPNTLNQIVSSTIKTKLTQAVGASALSESADTTDDDRTKLAQSLGLDTTAFATCLREGHYTSQVQHEMDEGMALDLKGTPSIYINGAIMNFTSYDEFFQLIDGYIATLSGSGAVVAPETTTGVTNTGSLTGTGTTGTGTN